MEFLEWFMAHTWELAGLLFWLAFSLVGVFVFGGIVLVFCVSNYYLGRTAWRIWRSPAWDDFWRLKEEAARQMAIAKADREAREAAEKNKLN